MTEAPFRSGARIFRPDATHVTHAFHLISDASDSPPSLLLRPLPHLPSSTRLSISNIRALVDHGHQTEGWRCKNCRPERQGRSAALSLSIGPLTNRSRGQRRTKY